MNLTKLFTTILIFVGGPVYAGSQPNILFILADDLGYGDVACYNSESKIPTPHLDKLAQGGMKFTDAHSPATVCTPSRYSLLTGRMSFRTGMYSVFTGVGGPCMIEEERLTLPSMLQKKGYTTALMGKWHVGMTFLDKEGEPINQNGKEGVERIDYSRSIPDSPIHRGFDHFFGTVSCPTTDWFYAFVEGDRVPVPPTKVIDRSKLPQHYYALDCRPGYIAPNFDLEEVDMTFLKKSEEFLDRHAKENPNKPFFLMHSAQAVHLPSFPGKEFQGKTEAGPHGDFIFQFDAIVGRLLKKLEEHGMVENTLIFLSSDNGPELPTVQHMRATHKHDGARPLRGVKRDNWEGGHRVPFIASWPGVIEEGSTSGQIVSLTDVMATCAEIVEYDLPKNAAEDSVSFLPVLKSLQAEAEPFRSHSFNQALRGALSIREGKWKFLDHQGSGGNNYSKSGNWGAETFAILEKDPAAPGQLYDLSKDPGETENLYSVNPDVVARLKAKLEEFKTSGRSAPWPRS
ncbi:MAG: sulfatase-like hydrolase/transferase [Akkermansiaceae bacterium]